VSLKETQIAKAKTLASQAELYVSSTHLQVVTIARTLEMDAGRMPFAERLQRIREQNALVPYLDADPAKRRLVYLSVVDTEGIGAQSGLDLQDPKLREQLQEGFQRGQNGTPMISVPIVADSLQEPVIIFGEPVKLAGRVLGVVLGVASLQPIREMTAGSSGASEVYVVDSRGASWRTPTRRSRSAPTSRRCRSSGVHHRGASAPAAPSTSRWTSGRWSGPSCPLTGQVGLGGRGPDGRDDRLRHRRSSCATTPSAPSRS
jgi:hypothetical protein